MVDFIVQASSRSWSGGDDLCMNEIDGKPAVYWTISNILTKFHDAKVVVAAPSFDYDSALAGVVADFDGRVQAYYGHDESPLLRLVAAHDAYLLNDYFVRVDGLNVFFLSDHVHQAHAQATQMKLDCVKFPDDYPAQITFDIYKKSALLQLEPILPTDSPFVVHPKYALFKHDGFSGGFYLHAMNVENEFLSRARTMSLRIYREERIAVTEQKISIGDSLSFHYELARDYVKATDFVLDIACGDGFGANILAPYVSQVVGADLSSEVIDVARASYPDLIFDVQNVNHTTYDDEAFDVVVSFETIEHVDDVDVYLSEIKRVLKPEGLFILSTPQNSLGHIPITSVHVYEYSLAELRAVISTQFEIIEVKGIKQGCIVFEDDPIGSNTFVVAKKKTGV